MRIIVFFILLASPVAHGLCLDPRGCAPATRPDCIAQAREAKTEAAARAQLAECALLPQTTLRQCKDAEVSWARAVKSNGGSEAIAPERLLRVPCRAEHPSTFHPDLWVTREYCSANAERLRELSQQVSPATGRSLLLEGVLQDNPALSRLSSWQLAERLQSQRYPSYSIAEVAAALGIDSPPDVSEVNALCARLAPQPDNSAAIHQAMRVMVSEFNAKLAGLRVDEYTKIRFITYDESTRSVAYFYATTFLAQHRLSAVTPAHASELRLHHINKTCTSTLGKLIRASEIQVVHSYEDATTGKNIWQTRITSNECRA